MATASGTQAFRHQGSHRSLSGINSTQPHLFFSSFPLFFFSSLHPRPLFSFLLLFPFLVISLSCLVCSPSQLPPAPLHSYRLPPPSRHAAAFDLNSDCLLSLFHRGFFSPQLTLLLMIIQYIIFRLHTPLDLDPHRRNCPA